MNTFYMTVGLVASGKSTWAENNKDKLNVVIHSSDAIREEFGDINDQSKNNLVFETLHRRVKEDLIAGKNVIYDATNLSRKRRIHFLSNELQNIPCKKVCVLFATPYEICLKNNENRERKVPEEVLERMYKSYEAPWYSEGFDEIQLVWWDYKKEGMEFDYFKDLKQWRSISHDNPHHALSIGNHMLVALQYYWANMCDVSKDVIQNCILSMAVLMHDCGKIATKSFIDSKGNPCETAHFYNHHNSGSYLSLFYLKEIGFTDENILHTSLLINLHMRQFLAWKDSDKAKEKDRKLFGDTIIKEVEVIHRCDLAGH